MCCMLRMSATLLNEYGMVWYGDRPGHALDVKVWKCDVNALVVQSVEQIVTLGVARVEAGIVG